MNGSPEHDLQWQAFAYWSDDLSPAERDRFELRLADEQQAREALARVVELSQAVVVVESLAVSPSCREPAGRSRTTIAWVAGFAASALALVLGFAMGQRPQWSAPARSTTGPIDPDLASAWSDIRSNWKELTPWQVANADFQADPAETADNNLRQTGADWDSADLETPSWMTAAVLGQAAETENAPDDLPDTDSLPGESSEES